MVERQTDRDKDGVFCEKSLNLDDTKSLSLRNEAPIFPKIQISPCNACFDSSVFHNASNATLAEQKHNSCFLSLQYRWAIKDFKRSSESKWEWDILESKETSKMNQQMSLVNQH